MTTAASPRGKATATTDVDSIMPLLFATIGNPAISFRKMAAMDAEKRTEASLEHKFRKWRQTGREIAEKNPEHAGTFTATTPKKPRAAPVKRGVNGGNKGKQPDVGDEEGAVDDEQEGGSAAVKLEGNDISAANCNNNNNSNKRCVSKDGDEDGENPAKKTKVTKKGTAKVVKKAATKPQEVSDDGDGSAPAEEVEAVPPKAKSRAKVATEAKAAANTGKKPTIPKWKSEVAAEQGRIALNGVDEVTDAEIDATEGDGMDGLVPMRFEQQA